MNPHLTEAAAQPSPAALDADADVGTASDADRRIDARLAHLFRASLKDGRIHPLYLPMLRYRHARAEA